VQVTAANPAATEQGTINLNVKVTGKGFKSGAKAKWFVTGTTDTGGVTVNSTTFVSSSEVTANITVADAATIANFDIQVTNSDGRGGKGTELFAVTAKGGGNASCPALQPAPTSDTKCYGAWPGCLDATFGGVGFVHFNPSTGGTGAAVPHGMAVQADGKIVVAIDAGFASTQGDIVVIRYNVDGSFDASFGDVDPFNPSLHLGYTRTSLTSTGGDRPYSLVLQPDGKIIVTGVTGDNRYVVLRYRSDGTLDPSFGSAGVAYMGTIPNEVALQSDGKIVIGGSYGTSDIAVTRLNINGSLDTSFGTGGEVHVNPTGSKRGTASGASVAIQRVPAVTGEERIVLAGNSALSSPVVWTIMRFRSNGATDTTFGSSGIVRTSFSGFGDNAHKVRIDSNNKIVVAGNTNSYDSSCGLYIVDAAVARYTQDGAVDGSFAGGKQVVDVYGGRDDAVGLGVQLDGKILMFAGADSADGVVRHTALIRFNTDGTRDSTFGLSANGIVTFDASLNRTIAHVNWSAFALSPVDGKIVVAGTTWFAVGAPDDTFVARYLP